MNFLTWEKSKLKLMLMLLLFGVCSSYTFAEELKLLHEKSFQVKDWESLYVKGSGADVKIKSWDKMEAYVKIYGNKRAEDKMKFSIDQEDNTVKVIAEKRGSFSSWFGGNIRVRIEVMVPKNHNAHVETSGGDINVADLTGVFKLFTSGGDVKLNNTNGKLAVETSGGDIELNKHKGEMHLETSGGDIICKGTTGDLKAETSGGDINLEVADGKIVAETSGGDITIDYSGINKGFKAETSGGDIHVRIPANFKAKAHLETTGGDITNNFDNSKTMHVSRSKVDADFNGGGEMFNLETTGGDVTVNQK